MMGRFLGTAVAAALALAAGAATAQTAATYPERAIRIVVPYAPGGFNDTMARVFAKKLQDAWGQGVVVENKGGAGTVLGTDAAAKAPADGYTLLVQGFPLVVNQYLHAKLPYDTKKDFTGVIIGGETPNLLLVPADSPIRTFRQLIETARAKPGKLSYGSSGTGTSQHLSMEYLKYLAKVDLTQIPYKGSSPMVMGMLAGELDVMFDNLPNAAPQVAAGKMRALGVTSRKRLPEHPDIPTIAEQGFPGFDVSVWYAVFAPTGTPKPIIDKLNAELARALKTDEVKQIWAKQGVTFLGSSVEDVNAFFKAQDEKWAPVIRGANIKAE